MFTCRAGATTSLHTVTPSHFPQRPSPVHAWVGFSLFLLLKRIILILKIHLADKLKEFLSGGGESGSFYRDREFLSVLLDTKEIPEDGYTFVTNEDRLPPSLHAPNAWIRYEAKLTALFSDGARFGGDPIYLPYGQRRLPCPVPAQGDVRAEDEAAAAPIPPSWNLVDSSLCIPVGLGHMEPEPVELIGARLDAEPHLHFLRRVDVELCHVRSSMDSFDELTLACWPQTAPLPFDSDEEHEGDRAYLADANPPCHLDLSSAAVPDTVPEAVTRICVSFDPPLFLSVHLRWELHRPPATGPLAGLPGRTASASVPRRPRRESEPAPVAEAGEEEEETDGRRRHSLLHRFLSTAASHIPHPHLSPAQTSTPNSVDA